jgi:hypothetical protein
MINSIDKFKICREFIMINDKFGRLYEFTHIVNSKVELMLIINRQSILLKKHAR